MHKIQKGMVPNPGVEFKSEGRIGVKAEIPLLKSNIPNYVKQWRYKSFTYFGPRLFNILPSELNSFEAPEETVDKIGAFKRKLDKFLSRIPDEPKIQGEARAANSNSLLDQQFYMQQ